MKDIQRLIEQRALHGKVFFSFQECKRFMCKLFLIEIDSLIKEGKIDPSVREVVCKDLALRVGLWDLYPHPTKTPIPDPQEVKTAIRIRIAQMRGAVVKLPVETETPNEFDALFDSL